MRWPAPSLRRFRLPARARRGDLNLNQPWANSSSASRIAVLIVSLPVCPESSTTTSRRPARRGRAPRRCQPGRPCRAGRGSGRPGCRRAGPRRAAAPPPRARRRGRSSVRRSARTPAARAAGGRCRRSGVPFGSSEMTASSHAHQSSRPCSERRVGVLHQAGVGGDEVAVAVGLPGHAGPEPLPRLGEEPPDPPVEPVDLRPAGRGDAGMTISDTRSGWRSA